MDADDDLTKEPNTPQANMQDSRVSADDSAAAAAAAMPPPRFTSRQPSAGQSGHASISSSGYSKEQSDSPLQPVGKAPVAGQSHAHRPVSAMPTASGRFDGFPSQQHGQHMDPSMLASMGNTAYNDRRASAQPTLPSTSHSVGHIAPPMGLSPSTMDSLAKTAITQGVPITSPAAIQYFAAHPRRQQVHFGSYLLLQTLGEGEFGKVKLGVHKEFGEEVAVKLIKRDKVGTPDGQLELAGPAKDPAKMSKIEKEIRVLKDVRHPNIVRLYEVIESDRYIGIVLEYASGGELFDHILAHKYLKDRDACRLFAQLVSGVNYLHHKKIVHRDLKLENLLLDRNRNVIITDFGFANNFENKRDDLMATSCGSPCYAAPELVVQDGLYAGSAVDVWSCGVILYAMLAGYLPFDDDPANPDGDNINLLYKYIMATPLSFPEYITAEPRDLLCKMLVPDPQRRATLEQVMDHVWLAPYRDLFKFTVDELERAAIEQQNKKRQVYQQQMLIQQQMQEQQRGGRGMHIANEQETTKQQRHRSAMAASSTMPDRMHESNFMHQMPRDETPYAQRSTAMAPSATLANVSAATVDAGEGVATPPVTGKSAASKTQRHTVQLEYPPAANQQSSRRRADGPSHATEVSSASAKQARLDDGNDRNAVRDPRTDANPVSQYVASHAGVLPQDAQPESSPPAARNGTTTHDRTGEEQTTSTASGAYVQNENQPSTSSPSRVLSESKAPTTSSTSTQKTPSPTRIVSTASKRSDKPATPALEVATSKIKGRTSAVKQDTNGTSPHAAGEDTDVLDDAAMPTSGRKSASHRRKAMSLVVSKAPNASDKEKEKAKKSERRLTGRLRKETIRDSIRPSTPKRTQTGSTAEAAAVPASSSFMRSPRAPAKQSTAAALEGQNDGTSSVGPSSSAAKKVMDWFRKRSLNRPTEERTPLGPFELNRPEQSPSSISSHLPQVATPDTPQVVVTNEAGTEPTSADVVESSPSSRSTSGTHSQNSQATGSTGLTAATEGVAAVSPSMPGQKSSSSTVQQQSASRQATPRASAASVHREGADAKPFKDTVLRLHQGAVDQSALTSRQPQDVFARVQRALWEMGIETRAEGGDEFKLECYRRKRAKTLMGATQGLGQSLRTSVFPPSQADYERSITNAGSRSPGFNTLSASMSTSPSTAGSIRSFLRRSSHQQSIAGGHGSSAGSEDGASNLPAPAYGEPAVDGGQEVRFSVEVTRIRNLPGLYSVDVRRMKGNLWAYKWVYHTLLDRCQLSGT